MLIVLEGIDGAGKTTQARMLADYLRRRGVKCMLTKEPTHGVVGSLIHKALYKLRNPLVNNKAANLRALQLLFVADRASHLYNKIIPKEKAGYVVVSDRYLLSTIAYGIASGVNKRWLIDLNKYFPAPDITLLLDVEPVHAIERLNKRDVTTEYFENLGFLKKSRRAYMQMTGFHKNCFVVDGNSTKAEVTAKIRAIVDLRIPHR